LLGDGAEATEEAAILSEERAQHFGQGEDDVTVGDRQEEVVHLSVPDRKPCDSAGLKTMIGWVFLEAFSSPQASAPSSFF
jgi:hypothetical protein